MATSYITNAALAQQITDLLNKWQTREAQMQAWMGGTANGGPFANGTYPLTDVLLNTTYQPSPAALVSGVGVSVASATAQAVLAAASATAAASSATGAAASASTATTKATAAASSAASAATHDTNCASLQALAQTSANAALASQIAAAASASAAATSASAAATSATSAATSATAAAASATSAAASAVLAATFVPALYALLAGATFTGNVLNTSSGNSVVVKNDTGVFNVRNTANTNVSQWGTVKGWTASGTNVTDTALGAIAALNFYVNGSTTAAVGIGTAGDVTFNTPTGAVDSLTLNVASTRFGITINTVTTAGNSFGLRMMAGTNASDIALLVRNATNAATFLEIFGNGSGTLGPSTASGISWTATGDVTIAASTGGSQSLLVMGTANQDTMELRSSTTSGQAYGLWIQAGTTAVDYSLRIRNAPAAVDYLIVRGDGGLIVGNPSGASQGVGTINATNYYKGGVELITTSTFVGTLTNMGSATTGTITYVSDGKTVTLYAKSAITGTSTANSMNLTGLPAAIQPVASTTARVANLESNGAVIVGGASTTAGSGTVSLWTESGGVLISTGFSATGTKGLAAGWSFTYPLS